MTGHGHAHEWAGDCGHLPTRDIFHLYYIFFILKTFSTMIEWTMYIHVGAQWTPGVFHSRNADAPSPVGIHVWGPLLNGNAPARSFCVNALSRLQLYLLLIIAHIDFYEKCSTRLAGENYAGEWTVLTLLRPSSPGNSSAGEACTTPQTHINPKPPALPRRTSPKVVTNRRPQGAWFPVKGKNNGKKRSFR
jgi:hypothetical protein